MKTEIHLPKPWWQVGLTVLPGTIFLFGQISSIPGLLREVLQFLNLGIFLALIASSIFIIAKQRSFYKLPVWGFIPLGLLAGLSLSGGLISAIGSLDSYFISYLLLAFTSAIFARQNGMRASLFILAGGIVSASWAVEPVMYFWDTPFWKDFVNLGMTILFMIITPMFMLRSRSILGQTTALLLPAAIYTGGFVIALKNARGIPVNRGCDTALPFIVLLITIAIAAPVYTWIASKEFPRNAVSESP